MEIPLTNLGIGEEAIITKLVGGFSFQKKMQCLGIRIGKKVKIISSLPFRGPITIQVNNTKVALGRGMANKIFVEIK